MNEEILKKTQESLGKIIGKKPPLTEKLLSRPPFRFLHDVLASVIKQTGFMKGLFSEKEASAESIASKEEKIAFLQKAVDIVVYASGQKLSVKPSKIVAGLEAEKTNEWLQALADAINKSPNNEECVKKVLGGSSNEDKPTSKPKESSKSKENENDREASADRRKRKDKDKEKTEEKENAEKGSHEKRPERDSEKRSDRDSEKRNRDSSRDGRQRDSSKDGRNRESSRNADEARERRGEERSGDKKEEEKRIDRKDDEKRSERKDKRKEERIEQPSQSEEDRKPSAPVVNGKTEPDTDNHGEDDVSGTDEEPQANRLPRPSSAKGSRRRHRTGKRPDTEQDNEDDSSQKAPSQGSKPVHEEVDAVPPQVVESRRLARPSSARPAPPKVKTRQEAAQEAAERVDSAKRVDNVIVDSAQHSDDDENFTVEEGAPPDVLPADRQSPLPATNEEEGKHGGLVKKILESKKEFDVNQNLNKTKIDKTSIVSDGQRQKEKEMVKKEVEKLRLSIQTLTRSANPLGKIMDYIQEDLHSMQKERAMWRAENTKLAEQINREMSVTDTSVEPLKAELASLEQAVADQLDRIAATKHNILRNDEKISKMLSSVAKT